MAAGWEKKRQLSGLMRVRRSSSVIQSGGSLSPAMIGHQWSSSGELVSIMRPAQDGPPSAMRG
jgi:hypothetical protein